MGEYIPKVGLALGLLLGMQLQVSAQIFDITAPSITTCTGAIVDSGGEGGPGYANNEYYVTTICPDAPGVGISLSFVIGNLNVAGLPTDELVIYDGNSLNAPVIGAYNGTSLQGAIIYSSYANTTGCLTLEFTSNATGTGSFAAAITCYIPCIPPTAVAVMSEAAPARICPGEAITFDGSASNSTGGFTIDNYTWDFADGTTATGTIVDHTFTEPGDYLVQLTLLDGNGCENTNRVDLLVLVGTAPNFAGTTVGPTVCEGGTIDLNGQPDPTTWTGLPDVDLGGGVTLPDGVGVSHVSSISNTYLIPNSTITSATDVLAICLNMEHSYMGDLAINITCPNGQSLALHQQGGGITYLGNPYVLDPGNAPVLGDCWEYCFTPFATNGTWAENASSGTTPSTIPGGIDEPGQSLIPGAYEPVGSYNDLLGCPLNGTWTLSVTDLWSFDNGFLCDWSMTFDPSLYPNIIQFTPTIGNTPDSMSWSGPGVVANPNDPSHTSAIPSEPGSHDYTFTVTDNFGCTYDTTLTVIVTNAPQVGATVTLGATCSDPAILEAEIVAFPPESSTCNYTLILHDTNGDGWSGAANLVVTSGASQNTYTMGGGTTLTASISVTTGDALSFLYTPGSFNSDNSFEVFDNSGALVYSSPQGPFAGILWTGVANCGPGTGPLVYTWSPTGSTTTATGDSTIAAVTVPTEVVVTVYPIDAPYCSTTDTVLVIPPSFLNNDSIVVDANCFGEEGTIQIITDGPSGPWNYSWQNAQGTVVRTTQGSLGDTLSATIGTYSVIVTEGPTGNGCIDTLIATITEPTLLEWFTVPSDTTICATGNAELSASATGGTAPIDLVWTNGLTGNGTQTISPAAGSETEYAVQAIDAHGCVTDSAFTTISVLDLLTFEPLVPDSECVGIPVPYEVLNAAGGNGDYTYDWGAGPGIDPTTIVEYANTANVCVTLNDGCETPPVSSCAELEILFNPELVLTADSTYGCAPFNVRFDILDTTMGASVLWDFGSGFGLLDSTNVTHLFEYGSVYDVSVDVLWPNGCHSDSTYVDYVTVLTRPIAHFDWNPKPASLLNPQVSFNDLSVPNVVAWHWDFGDFGTSSAEDTVIVYPSEIGGDYPVQLIVENALGCADSTRAIVEITDELLVYIPNAFTPNGVGPNEEFRVEGRDIAAKDFSLIIFDRWGQQVFNTTDPNEGWNGTMGGGGGTILPQGVYVYKLKAISATSVLKKEVMGHVTLLR